MNESSPGNLNVREGRKHFKDAGCPQFVMGWTVCELPIVSSWTRAQYWDIDQVARPRVLGKNKTIISKDFLWLDINRCVVIFTNSLFPVISMEAEIIYHDVDITQFPQLCQITPVPRDT